MKPKHGWVKAKQVNEHHKKHVKAASEPLPVEKKDDWADEFVAHTPKEFDALSQRLGAPGYFSNMIWEWLRFDYYGQKNRLSVHRFYKDKNVAIDINLKDEDQIYIPLKEKIFMEHGIQYFHLIDDDDVERMMKMLEAN